ncbi:MAG: dockerin type I repeat-containing protein [Phycisphaerales bacterium JB037]
MNQKKNLLCIAACGMAGGLVSVAGAQPFQVSGSGATLLQALLEAPAATNDFIDVDGDGISAGQGTGVDQLAPDDCSFPFAADQHWQLNYRIIGSANGFVELADWSFTPAFSPDGISPDAQLNTLTGEFSDKSIMNRFAFVNAGVPALSCYNLNFPGGTPWLATDPIGGNFLISSNPAAVDADDDGIRDNPADLRGMIMDFNPADVPAGWLVFQPGTPNPTKVPTAPGYGNSARLGVDPLTGLPTGEPNQLKSPDGFNGPVNFNTASPDQFTVYGTPITLTPVAAMVNPGVGMDKIDMSDLRHLTATGRRITGENLTKINRDAGSGTRNAFANGIGLDPSFAAGENIGPRTSSSTNDRVGPFYQPSNKGGSSRVDGTVINTRLGIGHSGAERGESSGWILGSNRAADVLAVRSDIKGGTVYARPTIQNVIDGSADGYNIIGAGAINTIGDPLSAPASLGGLGFPEPFEDGSNGQPFNGSYDLGENFVDMNGNGTRDAQTEPRPGTLNPAMRNPQAAAFLNNISRSVQGFANFSGDPNNPVDLLLFSPGEFLLTQFVLTAAADNINDVAPDPSDPFVQVVSNAGNQNPAVRQLAIDNSVLNRPEYAAFDFNSTGRVPVRTSGFTYSDGVAGGGTYIDQAGNLISYGSNLTRRNLIAGDFNGDAVRDINDAQDLVFAWLDRYGSCPADLTGSSDPNDPTYGQPDGDADGDDFFFYLDAFSTANLAVCDITGSSDPNDPSFGIPDGDCDGDDFFRYLDQFSLGCVPTTWVAPDGQIGSRIDGAPGSDAIIEVLGDFNNDGNFDTLDVRYWADGLAISGGSLRRDLGFAAVDNASLAAGAPLNFFGTVLANGTYNAGDSRGDVSNQNVFRDAVSGELVGTTRGWHPIGADGVVNGYDIDYVYLQFNQNPGVTDGTANWSDLAEAVTFDLSADMDGDLDVDAEDVRILVEDILETSFGDVNLDGVCNQADLDIANDTINNFGGVGGWADGDVNGDGIVDGDDLAIINGCI